MGLLRFFLYESRAMALNGGMARKQVKSAGNTQQDNSGKPDFDALLVAVGKNQDRESFIALFEYFAPRVKSFLMRRGTEEGQADELAQETMLTLWDKAASFDPARARASTWIFTIARNKAVDSLRRNPGFETELSDILPDEHAASPGEDIMQAEETEFLAEALSRLPAEQSDLIRKSFFEGKSHGDIAKETGIPLGTIKSRIRLALERLRGEEKVRQLW